MSTCLQILTTAFRRSGVLPFGQTIQVPNRDVGMEALIGMMKGWMTTGMLGQAKPILKTGTTPYTIAEENIHVTHPTTVVITLPATFTTLDGTVRTPYPMKFIIDTDQTLGTTKRYIWDTEKAAWLRIDNLVYTDYCPNSGEFEDEIKNLLAAYLSDEAGIPLGAIMTKRVLNAKVSLAARLGRPNRRDVGSYS